MGRRRKRYDSQPSSPADIVALCGEATSQAGKQLWQSGAVTNRFCIDEDVYADVRVGRRTCAASFAAELGPACDCAAFSQSYGDEMCAHVAAVLWAWLMEPQTFEVEEDDGFFEDDLDLFEGELGLQVGAGGIITIRQTPPPPVGAPAGESLPNLLAGYRSEDVRAIAKRHGWKLSNSGKSSLIAQLDGYLKDWAAAGNVDADLTADEAWLIRHIGTLLGPGAAPTHEWLSAAWKRSQRNLHKLDEALSGLFAAGLLFSCRQGRPLHYHLLPYLSQRTVPVLALEFKLLETHAVARLTVRSHHGVLDELARLGQAIESAGLSLASVPAPHPQAARFWWLVDWPYEAAHVQQLIDQNQVNYPHPGTGVPVRLGLDKLSEASAQLVRAWTGASPERAAWLVDIGLISGLFTSSRTDQAENLMGVNAPRWAEWSAAANDPGRQLQVLWQAWTEGGSDLFFELSWAARRHGNLAVMRSIIPGSTAFTATNLMQELNLARQLLVRFLAGLPFLGNGQGTALQGSAWVAWDELARMIFALDPDTLHFNFDRQFWWLATASGKHKRYDLRNREDWDRSVRHVLAAMIEGTLHWLGVVELGYEREVLKALRVTALGQWLLTGRGQFPSTSVDRASSQPSLWLDADTWRLSPGNDSPELVAMGRMLGEPGGAPYTYRLSEAGIERALLAGLTLQAIADRFEGGGIPLPPETAARLARAAARVGRVRLYEGVTLVECADDYALQELAGGSALRSSLVCQLSPRLVIVKAEGVDELVKELVNKGYTPRVQ